MPGRNHVDLEDDDLVANLVLAVNEGDRHLRFDFDQLTVPGSRKTFGFAENRFDVLGDEEQRHLRLRADPHEGDDLGFLSGQGPRRQDAILFGHLRLALLAVRFGLGLGDLDVDCEGVVGQVAGVGVAVAAIAVAIPPTARRTAGRFGGGTGTGFDRGGAGSFGFDRDAARRFGRAVPLGPGEYRPGVVWPERILRLAMAQPSVVVAQTRLCLDYGQRAVRPRRRRCDEGNP